MTILLNTTQEYKIGGNTGYYGINEIKEYADDMTDTIKRKVVFGQFDINGVTMDMTLGGDIDIKTGNIDFDEDLITHGNTLDDDDYEFVFKTLSEYLSVLLTKEVNS